MANFGIQQELNMNQQYADAVVLKLNKHIEQLRTRARDAAYRGLLDETKVAEATRGIQKADAFRDVIDDVQETAMNLPQSKNVRALCAALTKKLEEHKADMRERAEAGALAAADTDTSDSARAELRKVALRARLREEALHCAIGYVEQVRDEYSTNSAFTPV